MVMAMADWAVFGGFLMVAALVGWVAIRHLARQDQDPEVEKMWPEWWEGSPPDAWGHPVKEERLNSAISRILSWAEAPPAHAAGPARGMGRLAL
jgi:hypothetical protein